MAQSEHHYLYKRKAWKALRESTLARDMFRCQRCGTYLVTGRQSPHSAVVNHKTPHKGDLELFHDPSNLEAVCKQCHDSDIQREERNPKPTIGPDGWPTTERQPYSIPHGVKPSGIPVVLVSGPPASGKSTYVWQNAGPDDLVIDFDECRKAVGGRKWDTRKEIWRAAYAMRDRLIKSLHQRRDGKCYLIVTAPTADERRAWTKALGNVDHVIIKTPAEECIRRIRENPERAEAADSQINAVLNWWQKNGR